MATEPTTVAESAETPNDQQQSTADVAQSESAASAPAEPSTIDNNNNNERNENLPTASSDVTDDDDADADDDDEDNAKTPQPQVEMHPLNEEWTLWHTDGVVATKDWKKALQKVHDFGTVEDFWRLWNFIKGPKQLTQNSSFSVFRKGVRPEWEDAACAKGGTITYIADQSVDRHLTLIWRDLVLSMIGEQFGDCGSSIAGAYISNKRRQFRFQLWTKVSDESVVQKLGSAMRRIVDKTLEQPAAGEGGGAGRQSVSLSFQTHRGKVTINIE